MFAEFKTARNVRAQLILAAGMLDNSVAIAQDYASEEEFKTYRRAVGRVLGEMLDVLNEIHAMHNSLSPYDAVLRPGGEGIPETGSDC